MLRIVSAALLLLQLVAFGALTAISAAPVSLYAGSFTDFNGKPITFHPVRHEETGAIYKTDAKGFVRRIDLPVGSNVTFTLLSGSGFKETQTGTVTVPPGGFAEDSNMLILQAPSDVVFDVLNFVLPHKRNFSQCQIVTTVTNYGVTAFVGFPQGWPGVKAHLHPPLSTEPTFYFGTWAPFSNDTNPLPNNLTSLSWDGGVYFMNVNAPVGTEFLITASYGEIPFSTARAKCLQPGRLVNVAPNQGPKALSPIGDGTKEAAIPDNMRTGKYWRHF